MEHTTGTPKHEAAAPKGTGLKIKPMYGVAAIIALAFIVGAVYFANTSGATVVAGDNISVYYTGTFQNGTVFDTNVGKHPFNFTVGSGQVIQGFDQGVIGMKLNQNKTLTIPPGMGYGYENQSLIANFSRSQFGNAMIHVGDSVSTTQGRQGVIMAISANTVTVNFNPPLAGQTLIFQIKVISIKK